MSAALAQDPVETAPPSPSPSPAPPAAEASPAPACEPLVAEALDRALGEAEAAFAELDIERFIAGSDAVRAQLPCLVEVPPVPVVAHLDRVEGIRQFGERDVDAVRAFAAARALAPDYVFPSELAPPDSPILADYVAMDLAAGTFAVLPEPVDGTLWVDGRATRERPESWPALVQLVGADGAPRWSAWLAGGEAPPAYEAVPEPVVEVAPVGPGPVVPRARRSPRVPLLVAAAGTAIASGTLYGIGAGSRSRYFDVQTPDAELPALKARTNALAIGSAAGGVATLGLAAAVAITW